MDQFYISSSNKTLFTELEGISVVCTTLPFHYSIADKKTRNFVDSVLYSLKFNEWITGSELDLLNERAISVLKPISLDLLPAFLDSLPTFLNFKPISPVLKSAFPTFKLTSSVSILGPKEKSWKDQAEVSNIIITLSVKFKKWKLWELQENNEKSVQEK